MNDPFERFERSRGGLLIPVLLFFAGAVPTIVAIRALDGLIAIEDSADVEQIESKAVQDEVNDGDQLPVQDVSLQR